uniref:Cadherin domain-containing protein n=1 Tax=Anopheles culicifacies TaxID=139723 RepID=A0A182M1Z5_9DIPT
MWIEVTTLRGERCGCNRAACRTIELVNELGILKAKKTLNCEKRKNYKFDITAVFCDGSHSKSASVHISVIDINEYSPTFLQPSYVTEVSFGYGQHYLDRSYQPCVSHPWTQFASDTLRCSYQILFQCTFVNSASNLL